MKPFNLKITEEGLQTLMAALECYSRLGINQFAYCLDHNPAFAKLDYEKRHEIENYLKTHIDSRSFGIYHHQVTDFNKAFEIKKEIQKAIAVSQNPIVENYNKDYEGALIHHDYIPKFYDEDGNEIDHKISIKISPKHKIKIQKFAKEKDYKKMWDYIDKYIKPSDINGSSCEMEKDFNNFIIYKPYKIKQ